MKKGNSKVSASRSVKTRLVVVMVLLTAIPLLISTIYNYVNTMNRSLSNAEEVNEKQLEIISGNISDLINQNVQAIVTMANSPEARVFERLGGKYRDVARFVKYLKTIDESLADGNSTVITNAAGDQLARSSGKLTNTADREYYTHAMNGEVYISEVVVSKTTGARIVVPVAPVRDDDDVTVMGFIQRNFDLNVLHELLASEADKDQVIVITDRNGMVIAHSGHEITADDPEDDRSGASYYTSAAGGRKETVVEHIGKKRYIISSTMEPTTGWVIINERDYDSVMSHAMLGALVQVLIVVVALVIAILIAFAMANSFVAPIFAVDQSLEKLSSGEFQKVTDEKFMNREDEFGNMVRDTNSVIDRLEGIVRNIKTSAASVGSSSMELADTTTMISRTADDVSTAVQGIAAGASQQADEIQHATENTGRISENILQVSNDAIDLETTAKSMSDGSRESVTQLEKLRDSSEQMKVSIDEISERIGATSRAVENINSRVASITSIASQTNLLALNASIEAARAGDAGKGFAVVAEEIGKLADDSAVSAGEIRKEMTLLLAESQAAVTQAASVRESTEEQGEILAATVESVTRLIEDIQRTVDGVHSINEAAELCSDSKSVVVDAMSSLSAISEENAAASEETNASMQELGMTVNTLASAADQLKDIAEKLGEDMSFFR